MSIKLKSIEIEAFRAYKERQIFNFECPSGKLANLVVIYAPNGFGKTSFFDAIEWSITGKINRISKNPNVKSIAEEEQGNILKNIDSTKLYGTVKIIGEHEEILETHTKTIGIHNRKTDYHEGDLVKITTEFKKLQQTDFCSTNLLAHDKIDAFLRFSNPKERYETLSNFWDVNSDTQCYKTILAIYKEAIKNEDEITEEISKLKMELNSISFSQEKINYLNSLIKNFNNNNYHMVLDESIDGDIKKNLDKCMEYRSVIVNWNNELNVKVTDINSLVQEFSQYIENNLNLVSLKDKIKDITLNLNKFGYISKKENTLSELTDANKKKRKRLEKYNELISSSSTFKSMEDSINKILLLNQSTSREISELSKNNIDYETKILDSEKIIKESETEFNLYSKLNTELDIKLIDYKRFKEKEQFQIARLHLINKIIKLRLKRIDDFLIQTTELSGLLNLDNKLLLEGQYKYTKYKDEYLTCKDVHSEFQKLQQSLQAKEIEYKNYGKLNDQLNTIVKYGKDFIEQTKATKCPLCNMEYENFKQLIENVNSSFDDTFNLDKIYNDIIEMKNLLNNKKEQLNYTINHFRIIIEDEIKRVNEEIMREKSKIQRGNNNVIRIKNKIKESGNGADEIVRYFLNFNIKIVDININDIKSVLSQKIREYNKLIYEQKFKSQTLKENYEANQKLIINKKNAIEINKAKIEELKSNPEYIGILNLSSELGIDINSASLSSFPKQLELIIIKENEEIISLSGDVLNLKNELQGKDINKLNTDLMVYEGNLITIENKVATFINRYRNVINKEEKDILLEDLNEEQIKVKKKLVINENMLKNLNEISVHLDYLQKNKEWLDKKVKIEELNNKLKGITTAKTELCKSKDESIQYIINRINNYFNLNIINQVYGRIDPHPNLTYINFEPEFSKDMPELNIHAFSNDSNHGIAPILYFSSAQVNILSLSIFLARSLQNKDYGLNTIFMDDPIQHLDSINILSFIDLLRSIVTEMDRQIILSTHNESFFRLIKKKIDPEYFNSKYLELETYGIIKHE